MSTKIEVGGIQIVLRNAVGNLKLELVFVAVAMVKNQFAILKIKRVLSTAA